MKVYGIDFTSAPTRRKPIACLACTFDGRILKAEKLEKWTTFDEFEDALERVGPWIAGIDFPFGQSRKFVETIGWPNSWSGYVMHAQSLGRQGYRAELDTYRAGRVAGDKEHRRQTDIGAGSISPQKLYGVPVGLMFFEGARRLVKSGVTIPHLQNGDSERLVVEAYPGVLARQIIDRRSYKQDTKRKQTYAQHFARCDMLMQLHGGAARKIYGFEIDAPEELCEDPGGDHLDALLCAIQAAWAWQHRSSGFGAPNSVDTLEGWIADPCLLRS